MPSKWVMDISWVCQLPLTSRGKAACLKTTESCRSLPSNSSVMLSGKVEIHNSKRQSRLQNVCEPCG
jgi:hypothetical protein